jgi:hypothetical protein
VEVIALVRQEDSGEVRQAFKCDLGRMETAE